jgi:hypothetical protein
MTVNKMTFLIFHSSPKKFLFFLCKFNGEGACDRDVLWHETSYQIMQSFNYIFRWKFNVIFNYCT